MRFALPIDRFQRALAGEALAAEGAPFDATDATTFRADVTRVWARYQSLRAERSGAGVARVQHALDRRVWQRGPEEHIDDPTLPDATRTRLIRELDRLNRAIGAYHFFDRALAQHLEGAPDEIRVLDVGSGHGAFPIRLAERARDGGRRLHVTGSDLEPAYVAAAQAAAVRAGVAVEFRVIDALALDRLDEQFDVITCTQTVHHFPPEFLAELMVRAHANARWGLVLFDARRSVATLAGVALGTFGTSLDPMFLHDGVVSIRRMYAPAELELLAACSGTPLRATNFGPQYVVAESRAL